MAPSEGLGLRNYSPWTDFSKPERPGDKAPASLRPDLGAAHTLLSSPLSQITDEVNVPWAGWAHGDHAEDSQDAQLPLNSLPAPSAGPDPSLAHPAQPPHPPRWPSQGMKNEASSSLAIDTMWQQEQAGGRTDPDLNFGSSAFFGPWDTCWASWPRCIPCGSMVCGAWQVAGGGQMVTVFNACCFSSPRSGDSS